MPHPTSITLCMGSSCFSRGNAQNLPRIQAFLRLHALETRVDLKGCRCGSACADGPNLWIDGQRQSNMTPEALERFLASLAPETRNAISTAAP